MKISLAAKNIMNNEQNRIINVKVRNFTQKYQQYSYNHTLHLSIQRRFCCLSTFEDSGHYIQFLDVRGNTDVNLLKEIQLRNVKQ